MKRALKRCCYHTSTPKWLRQAVYIYLPYGVCLSGDLIPWHDGQFRLVTRGSSGTSVTFRDADVVGVHVGTGRSFWLRGAVLPTMVAEVRACAPRRASFAEQWLDMLRK